MHGWSTFSKIKIFTKKKTLSFPVVNGSSSAPLSLVHAPCPEQDQHNILQFFAWIVLGCPTHREIRLVQNPDPRSCMFWLAVIFSPCSILYWLISEYHECLGWGVISTQKVLWTIFSQTWPRHSSVKNKGLLKEPNIGTCCNTFYIIGQRLCSRFISPGLLAENDWITRKLHGKINVSCNIDTRSTEVLNPRQ